MSMLSHWECPWFSIIWVEGGLSASRRIAPVALVVELSCSISVMLRFEGTQNIIPAPPLRHSNQTPVTDLPRLRAFSLPATRNARPKRLKRSEWVTRIASTPLEERGN